MADTPILLRVAKGSRRTISGTHTFHAQSMFAEQLQGGWYIRPYSFFLKYWTEFMGGYFEVMGIDSLEVMYTGVPGQEAESPAFRRVNGVDFPKGEWVKVPLDFDPRDMNGNDAFKILGFKVKHLAIWEESLADCKDGDKVLIGRKWGGLGDQFMASIAVHNLARQYPHLDIHYACPKKYMPIFEDCEGITLRNHDEVMRDSFYFHASSGFVFYADISSACANYESGCHKKGVPVIKHRSEVWAEHIGFKLKDFSSCYKVRPEEREAAKTALKEAGIGKCPIAIGPFSAGPWRSYPTALLRELVGLLKSGGYSPFILHDRPIADLGCPSFADKGIREVAALIDASEAVVAVATAHSCIAQALSKPAVLLFGMVGIEVFKKAHPEAIYLSEEQGAHCPCWYSKMESCRIGDYCKCLYVKPERVSEALRKVLSKPPASAGRKGRKSSALEMVSVLGGAIPAG